jgi:hypothetical protein
VTCGNQIFTTEWLVRRMAEELGRIGSFPLCTAHIRQVLVRLGRDDLKLEVYPDTPGDKRNCHREFLWDFTWWEENSNRSELVLAAESEWCDTGDVCFDFEKLLVAKCPYKLLITDAGYNGRSVEYFQSRIEGCLKKHFDFRRTETYVWIDHRGDPGRSGGLLRAFEFKPENDGPSKGPYFRKLDDGNPFPFRFEHS